MGVGERGAGHGRKRSFSTIRQGRHAYQASAQDQNGQYDGNNARMVLMKLAIGPREGHCNTMLEIMKIVFLFFHEINVTYVKNVQVKLWPES